MGKKRGNLSHEEIWDDSALLDSWDAALQEYQLYHSIHARGERVEDVLRDAGHSQEVVTDSNGTAVKLSSSLTNGLPHPEDFEDGEIEEGQVDDSPLELVGAEEERTAVKAQSPANQQDELPPPNPDDNNTESAQVSHGVPESLTTGVQDEGLKNLMMSWYYAGYYTGLYEGRQHYGGEDMMKADSNGKNAAETNNENVGDMNNKSAMNQNNNNAMEMGSGSSEAVVDVSVVVISSYAGGNAPVQQIAQPPMAKGKVHKVIVGGEAGLIFSPNSIMAAAGDMVEFTFMSQNHTVTQSTFPKPCVKMQGGADSLFLPNPNNTISPSPTYMLQVKDTKPAWFYCKQKKPVIHCGMGMTFSINPAADKTHDMFTQKAKEQNGTAAAGSSMSMSNSATSTVTAQVAPATTSTPAEGTTTSAAAAPPVESAPAAAASSLSPMPGAAAAPAPAPAAPASSPPQNLAAPPAMAPGGSMVVGSGNMNGGQCSCSCLCGTAAFPAGAGIGMWGGYSGAVAM
ncbi:MAG: hypothetical protein LQ343_005568 [Gyalolechia ehrenbergii]|nr:MAG: hypothetical protein LQ343_005568 [Gyalolechia ehrenbergii]